MIKIVTEKFIYVTVFESFLDILTFNPIIKTKISTIQKNKKLINVEILNNVCI